MTVVYRLLRDDGDAFCYLLPCISGQLESLHSISRKSSFSECHLPLSQTHSKWMGRLMYE